MKSFYIALCKYIYFFSKIFVVLYIVFLYLSQLCQEDMYVYEIFKIPV